MKRIGWYASLLLFHALACSPIDTHSLPAAEEDGGPNDSEKPDGAAGNEDDGAGSGGRGGASAGAGGVDSPGAAASGGTAGDGAAANGGSSGDSAGASGGNGGAGGDGAMSAGAGAGAQGGASGGAAGMAGSSGAGPTMCPPDRKPCGSECVPASGCCDASECPMGASCEKGMCVCPAGTHLCDDACASDTAPESCGTSCDPCEVPTGGTAACTAGECMPMCPAGQKICAGACIAEGRACDGMCPAGTHDCMGLCSQNTSPMTCGTMCTACPKPSNGSATCDGTACGFNCNNGFKKCKDSCQPECCSNTDCGANEVCENGTCECVPQCQGKQCGPDGCGGFCQPNACQRPATCNAQGMCECVPRPNVMCGSDGCTDKGPCRDGYRCDNGTCVCVPRPNVQCGNDGCTNKGPCPAGSTCNSSGQCVCEPDCTPCGVDRNDCPQTGSTPNCVNQCTGNRVCDEARQVCVDKARCGDGMVTTDQGEECDPAATNDYHCDPVSCQIQVPNAETAFDACSPSNPSTCTGNTSCGSAFDFSMCFLNTCDNIPAPFRQIDVGPDSALPYCFLDCSISACPNNTRCESVDFFGQPTLICRP